MTPEERADLRRVDWMLIIALVCVTLILLADALKAQVYTYKIPAPPGYGSSGYFTTGAMSVKGNVHEAGGWTYATYGLGIMRGHGTQFTEALGFCALGAAYPPGPFERHGDIWTCARQGITYSPKWVVGVERSSLWIDSKGRYFWGALVARVDGPRMVIQGYIPFRIASKCTSIVGDLAIFEDGTRINLGGVTWPTPVRTLVVPTPIRTATPLTFPTRGPSPVLTVVKITPTAASVSPPPARTPSISGPTSSPVSPSPKFTSTAIPTQPAPTSPPQTPAPPSSGSAAGIWIGAGVLLGLFLYLAFRGKK